MLRLMYVKVLSLSRPFAPRWNAAKALYSICLCKAQHCLTHTFYALSTIRPLVLALSRAMLCYAPCLLIYFRAVCFHCVFVCRLFFLL